MEPLATLSDQARYEIERLEAKGIRLTAEQIVHLNALGHDLETPAVRRQLAKGRPVPLAGAWLWPLTLYAINWLNDVKTSMDAATQDVAVGYAMAHQYDAGEPLQIDESDAARVVKSWLKTLRCPEAEFREAVQQVLFQDQRPPQPVDPNGEYITYGDLSAFLAAACGGDVEFWERRCANSYAASVLTMFTILNHAGGHSCAGDPRLAAERAIGLAIEEIEKQHAAQQKALSHGS